MPPLGPGSRRDDHPSRLRFGEVGDESRVNRPEWVRVSADEVWHVVLADDDAHQSVIVRYRLPVLHEVSINLPTAQIHVDVRELIEQNGNVVIRKRLVLLDELVELVHEIPEYITALNCVDDVLVRGYFHLSLQQRVAQFNMVGRELLVEALEELAIQLPLESLLRPL